MFVAADMPVVACVCIWTGIDNDPLSSLTREKASKGRKRPAMSLIAKESAPASSIFLAKSNQVFKL